MERLNILRCHFKLIKTPNYNRILRAWQKWQQNSVSIYTGKCLRIEQFRKSKTQENLFNCYLIYYVILIIRMDKTKKQIRKSRELKTPLFLYMVKLSSQTERKKKIMYACVWECVCVLCNKYFWISIVYQTAEIKLYKTDRTPALTEFTVSWGRKMLNK